MKKKSNKNGYAKVSFYATTGTIGISYCKEPFKWFKGCELKKIEDIFKYPLNYV